MLSYYELAHTTNGAKTKNWVHPFRHAEIPAAKVPAALKKLPQKVTGGKEYPW